MPGLFRRPPQPWQRYNKYPPAPGGGGPVTYNQAVTGAVTPTGSIVNRVSAFKTGTATSSSLLAARTTKFVAGSIASSGAKVVVAKVVKSGAITPSGLDVLRVARYFTGTSTQTGTIKFVSSLRLAGALAPSGTLAKSVTLRRNSGISPGADPVAFPNDATAVTDDLNRADEDPILAPWEDYWGWGGVVSGNRLASKYDVTNEIYVGGAYWATDLPGDFEVVFKLASTLNGGALDPNGDGVQIGFGYDFQNAPYINLSGDGIWFYDPSREYPENFFRARDVVVSSGDLVGLRVRGSLMEFWHKPVAGSRSLVYVGQPIADVGTRRVWWYSFSGAQVIYLDDFRVAALSSYRRLSVSPHIRESGAVAPTATVADLVALRLSGAITASGAEILAVITSASGSIASSGSLAKTVKLALGGSVSAAGADVETLELAIAITGAVASSADVTKRAEILTSGAETPSSVVALRPAIGLVGDVDSSASVTKRASRVVDGSTSSFASLTQTAANRASGAVASQGSQAVVVAKRLVGVEAPTSLVALRAAVSLVGDVASSGDDSEHLTRTQQVSGVVPNGGTIVVLPTARLAGAVASSSSLAKTPESANVARFTGGGYSVVLQNTLVEDEESSTPYTVFVGGDVYPIGDLFVTYVPGRTPAQRFYDKNRHVLLAEIDPDLTLVA